MERFLNKLAWIIGRTIYHFKKTWRNKLMALLLIGLSILVPFVDNGDATASVLVLMFAIPLLFTKEDVFKM